MKMHKLAVALAALSFGVISAPTQAASIWIDTFQTSQTSGLVDPVIRDFTATPGDTGVTIASGVGSSVSGAGILGGNREIYASKLTGAAGKSTGIIVNNGAFSFENASSTTGRGQIQWDGAANTDETIDYTGLYTAGVGLDLTDGGTTNTDFALDIVFADAGFNFSITVYTSATQWTTVALVANEHLSPITTLIPFSAFTDPGLCGFSNLAIGVKEITCAAGNNVADMTKVGAIVADIDRTGATPAFDFEIDGARAVPEPGVLGLLGIGMLGLAAVVARRRKTLA